MIIIFRKDWPFLMRGRLQHALVQQLGWTMAGYGVTQVIRLASNLALTRLLAPDLFGMMILLTSIRVGIELFTDIGIGQNVVASERADEQRFYNTAWTLQILRGLMLGLGGLLLLPLLSRIYDQAALSQILPVISLFLILTGVHSIGPSLAVKHLETRRLAFYEIITAAVQAMCTIAAVLVSSTILGLLVGQIVGAALAAAGSYFVRPGLSYKLMLDGNFTREIASFGKWIFIASIVFFLSGYLDRLFLGKYVTFAMLGIYGVARSLADLFGQLSSRLGNAIVFPKIVSASLRGPALRARLYSHRLLFLATAAGGIAIFIALAEPLVRILYNPRYFLAASILPWLAVGAWFGIINTLNDSVLLGVSRPQYNLLGNVGKLVALVILLPWGLSQGGIIGAAIATMLAEIFRYGALSIGQIKEEVPFFGQDVILTLALVTTALLLHAGLTLIIPQFVTLSPFVISVEGAARS